MNILRLPILDELGKADNILLAGAGGGFDVFSGLPLYFALRQAGKKVHLANFSFSKLAESSARPLAPFLFEVTADTTGNPSYFPEMHLSRWFRQQGLEMPVYSFQPAGCQPLTQSYRWLVDHLRADTVVLVDGGTDSLLRGDEAGLGSPDEDMVSIAAAAQVDVARKFLICVGFGVDAFHGVCHNYCLETIAELTKTGDFLGVFSYQKEMPEVQRYREAVLAVFEAMPEHPSIVSASILSSIEGHFGNYHMTEKTADSKQWISPLMPLCWCFRLEGVARRVLYLDAVRKTEHFWQVREAIEDYRFKWGGRPWVEMPI